MLQWGEASSLVAGLGGGDRYTCPEKKQKNLSPRRQTGWLCKPLEQLRVQKLKLQDTKHFHKEAKEKETAEKNGSLVNKSQLSH